ncbi:MAG: cytochrome c4 [Burkholderiaceae bacterium]|nr:cytochrome c4 [Burkholderiaceae bacterium]
MNKLLITIFALAVASVTSLASAQELKGDAKAAEGKIAMCVGCHGIKGYQASFPEVHKVPMISGQSAKYITSALHEYQKGDRKHPTMRGIAASLTEQDIADISAYYSAHGVVAGATLPDTPARTPGSDVAPLLAKGNCVSCHGSNFSKPIDVYPKIAGQHGDYLFVALKSYKADKSTVVGRNNAIMGAIAKQFSNAELKTLAGYVSSLDGELKTVPESKFR